MCLAFYTVNLDRFPNARAYIVRVFSDDRCVKTAAFPIGNPNNPTKSKRQAEEFGKYAVKEIIDREIVK